MSDQFNVQPGTVFAGDFRVDRALSQGGMGAVYVAEQISTGKPRALKVMLPALVSDPSLRKRFEQEARIGSLIESEHVVEVVGAGIDAGTGLPWLAMELLQGEDLDHVVTERGALSVHEVAQLFQQLCHAVGAAHKVGVVHRDLKPENVFLAKARRADATFMVKVLDFGIAKIVAEASTKQTAAMGSPIWMAPEQADQSSVTPATDVWALGLIAFFLLTGRPFWRSANDDNSTIPMVLKEVLFEPIAPASVRAQELGRALPYGFEEWFSHCVSRDPAMRFPDAGQAGDALVSILGGAPPPSVLASEAYPGGYAGQGGLISATGMQPSSGSYASGPGLPASGGGYGSGPVQQPSGGGYGSGPVAAQAHTGQMPQQQVHLGTSASLSQQGARPLTAPMPVQPAISGTGVPGAYSIPNAAEEHPPPAKKFPVVVAVAIILGVAVIGAASAFMLTRKPPATQATVTPIGSNGPVSSSDANVVAEAKKLSEDGKFDLAHQRLQQIPATSEARQSDAYRDVEFKWATETILLAEKTPAVATKRALLSSVTQCASVDETLRSSAKEKLAAIDGPDGGPVARGGGRHPSSGANPTPPPPSSVATINNPTTNLQPGFQPTPNVPPANPFGNRSVSEVAASNAQSDWSAVRQVEDPRVRAQVATPQEAHALAEACRKLKDKPCEAKAKQYLKNHH